MGRDISRDGTIEQIGSHEPLRLTFAEATGVDLTENRHLVDRYVVNSDHGNEDPLSGE